MRPLTCREIAEVAVPGAARASGARGLVGADAVVTVDVAEHARRAAMGLGAVPDYSTLYALMCLPIDAAVPVADLGGVVRRLLSEAPPGCVEWLGGATRVRRCYVPAATVGLVVVRGATWRPALRRAAAFEPFAARVVLLPRPPRRVADIAWEADVDGTGLWITRPGSGSRDAGEIEEIVAPEPYVSRHLKPAKWRFAEHAYAAWLTHTAGAAAGPAVAHPPGCSAAGPGEPSPRR